MSQPAQPILVTGATGFIGRRLVEALCRLQLPVTVLIEKDETPPPEWNDKITLVRGGTTRRGPVTRAMQDVKTVFHLAALVTDWGPDDRFERIMIRGTRNILDAAVENRSRVVLCSSIVVYGDRIGLQPCHESVPHGKPASNYSYYKQAQETLVNQYRDEQDLAITIVRPGNVYGPGNGPWVNGLLREMRRRHPVLVNQGNQCAGLVYVDNVVDLLILAGSRPEAINQTYNAADETAVTWGQYTRDLASAANINPPRSMPLLVARSGAATCEFLWKLLGIRGRPPITRERVSLISADHQIRYDKATTELDFKPRVGYDEGIAFVREYIASEPAESY